MWPLAVAARRVAAASTHASAQLCPQACTGFSTQSRAGSDEDARSALAYCVEQVRNMDHDNYVWLVQQPKEMRPALFALRAFNIETATIADQVRSKESPMVHIRYQWWRDAVSAIFSSGSQGSAPVPKHPVVQALHYVQKQYEAPFKKYHFNRLIDAREQDLMDTQPPLSVSGLETYSESTASQLLYLQLGASKVTSKEADHAASHLGKAVGITTLLRGTPYHAVNRRSYMPIELCAKHKVSQEDIYVGAVSEGLQDVVLAVASVAKAHLEEARALQSKVPAAVRGLMLPSIACDAYLKALEAANFNPFDPVLLDQKKSALMHVLRVKYHLMMKSY